MKAFVLLAASLLVALPAHSDTSAESAVASPQPADPSIVNPKAIGQHSCLDQARSWMPLIPSKQVVSVHATFQIAADGTISDVAVNPSSGNARLDEITVHCVERWRYEPATKDGQAIALPWDATVRYWRG